MLIFLSSAQAFIPEGALFHLFHMKATSAYIFSPSAQVSRSASLCP